VSFLSITDKIGIVFLNHNSAFNGSNIPRVKGCFVEISDFYERSKNT
jgi:hypothetical protein